MRSVKMRRIGHRLHADAELDIDPTASLTDAHRIVHEAEHTLDPRRPQAVSRSRSRISGDRSNPPLTPHEKRRLDTTPPPATNVQDVSFASNRSEAIRGPRTAPDIDSSAGVATI